MKTKNLMYLIPLLLLATSAHADAPGIGEMFANFQASAEAIIKLLKTASYVIGLYLVVGAIFKFIQLQQQGQVTLKTPIIMFLSGVGIFALTGSMSVVSQTLSMGDGPGSLLMPAAGGMAAAQAAGSGGKAAGGADGERMGRRFAGPCVGGAAAVCGGVAHAAL